MKSGGASDKPGFITIYDSNDNSFGTILVAMLQQAYEIKWSTNSVSIILAGKWNFTDKTYYKEDRELIRLMDIYKLIHVSTAVLSISGFIMRGFWRLTDSPLLKKKLIKIVPHIIDSVLLISAILLAMKIEQYPFAHDWLTAKVVALIIYILLGTVTLRFARSFHFQLISYIGAILTFSYIVSVAITKQVQLF